MARINSRSKGRRGEKKARLVLSKWTGLEFAGVPASGGLRWKNAENISGDIVCTDALHRFDFSVEVKNYADINFEHLLRNDVDCEIIKYWSQCIQDADRGKKLPLLMMRYNGMPSELFFTVIRFKHFKLFKKHLDTTLPYFKFGDMVFMNSGMITNSDYKTIKKITSKIIKSTWN